MDMQLQRPEVNHRKWSYDYFHFFSFAELPPRPLLERLAKELRRRLVLYFLFSLSVINCVGNDAWCLFYSFCILVFIFFSRCINKAKTLTLLQCFVQGLRLFNLDIIRELGTKDRFYVIDINYFPGKQSLLRGITLSSVKSSQIVEKIFT